MKRTADRRLRLLIAAGLFGFAVIAARAVQVQVVDADSLSARAPTLQTRQTVDAGRGTVYSADGKVLAVEIPAVTIYADPLQVRRPGATADRLASLLGYTVPPSIRRPRPKVLKQMTKRERKRVLEFVARRRAKVANRLAARRAELGVLDQALAAHNTFQYIARQLTPQAAQAVTAAHLPGIHSMIENRRWYPYHTLAAQLLGFTDIDGSAAAGEGGGLENLLNASLAGRPGLVETVTDPTGQQLERLTLRRVRPGHNVRLTIDTSIQTEVQTVLAETQRRWHARSATAIVLDPRTGAVLAMASAPTFDANRVHDLSTAQFDRLTPNLATNMVYDPGSVFKVVTFSAALTNHIITPDELFRNIPYEITLGGRTIHDDEYRGPISYTAAQILRYSSNIGTI